MAPSVMDPQADTDTQAVTFSDRMSVNGVEARRSKHSPISKAVAAHASSDMFKSPGYGKPKAKKWDHRLNEESKSRKPSSLKGAARYLQQPGLVSLGGGLPSSEYFPFERIDITVPAPPDFSEAATKESGIVKSAGKRDIAEGKSIFDMHVAFNYGQATGSAQLLRFLTEHTEIVHNPPYQDWQCAMTVGNTSALDMALRMFTVRGDYVLTDNYMFCSALETAIPMGVKCIGIDMDSEGLLPSSLENILANWNPSAHQGASKPWLLYTVPTGQNPTGATQSEQRRRDIYRIAQQHDIYILEDEPYYYLQMQPYTGLDSPSIPPLSSHEEFLASLVPSYLSMDIDGRVMRMDSFSKVVAPGLRTGWIVASEQIVERYVRHAEVSTHTPSGPSQLMLFKLLEETWGHDGYLDWLMNLRAEYTSRRDNICEACERCLPKAVATFDPPMAGMFLWIKILWHKHPAASSSTKGLLAIEDEVYHACIDRGVLASKGSWFRAEQQDAEPTGADDMFFRMTFAAASSEAVREAVGRFGAALRAVFGLEEQESNGNGNGNGIVNGH